MLGPPHCWRAQKVPTKKEIFLLPTSSCQKACPSWPDDGDVIPPLTCNPHLKHVPSAPPATCSKPLYKAAHHAAACERSLTALGWQSAIQNDNHLSLCAYLWERTEKNVILSILVKKPHDEQNLWGCTPPGPAAGTRHRSRQPSAGEVSALKTKLGRVTTHCRIPKRQERAKLPGKYLFCCLQVWS